MRAWIGITGGGAVVAGEPVRLFREHRDQGSSAALEREDRIRLVEGETTECRVIEAASTHLILECGGRHLLAVPAQDDNDGLWTIAAVRDPGEE